MAVTFTNSDFAPNNVALIPTQIYSGFLDFAHFLLLLYVAKHKKADGQVAACYLIFYSIGRFVIEFFRGDIERGSVGVLSTSQFIRMRKKMRNLMAWRIQSSLRVRRKKRCQESIRKMVFMQMLSL